MNTINRKRNKPSHEHLLYLGFSGKTKSGKTTSAEYIGHKFGGVKFAFADSLKASVFDLNYIRGRDMEPFLEYAKERGHEFDFHGFPRANMTNPNRANKIAWINRNKEDFGDVLQVYGDYKRSDNPNYFIERTMLAIHRAIDDGQIVICVDDVRYTNEVDALTEAGFEIIRVQAGDDIRVTRGAARNPDHSSETQLDSHYHNYNVFNNSQPHDLYRQIDTVVDQILNKQ